MSQLRKDKIKVNSMDPNQICSSTQTGPDPAIYLLFLSSRSLMIYEQANCLGSGIRVA